VQRAGTRVGRFFKRFRTYFLAEALFSIVEGWALRTGLLCPVLRDLTQLGTTHSMQIGATLNNLKQAPCQFYQAIRTILITA
jgi:hypothetical protein